MKYNDNNQTNIYCNNQKTKGEMFMRKFAFASSLLAVVLLVGCGKTITKQEAIDYAKTNYSLEKVQEQQYKSTTTKSVINVKEASGIFAETFKEGKTEDTTQSELIPPSYFVTSGMIQTLPEDIKYTLSGKSLTFTKELTPKDIFGDDQIPGITGSGTATQTLNELGLLVKSTQNINFSVEFKQSGISITGKLNMSTTMTISYNK